MTTQHGSELYRRVDEVLYYVWDPIGVSGIPSARNEYQSYVPRVVELLNENATSERIATYLNEVVTKRMELTDNVDDTLHVVELILDWKAALTASSGR